MPRHAPAPAAPETLLVGLIGAGIQRSRSPRMHREEAASHGLACRYVLFDLDEEREGAAALPRLLEQAEQAGFAGLNITYPCKQQVVPLLDTLSEDAARLNSVNTVLFRSGRREGHNTDWWGFAESFRRGLPLADLTRVVLVGAGGAGAAVAYAALQLGANSLLVHDSDAARSTTLVERLQPLFPDSKLCCGADLPADLRAASGLIHATPTGMAKTPGLAVPADSVQPPLWVAEVVYVPLETQLLALARSRGCRVLPGGGMAVLQAAQAFALFSGRVPDVERMLGRFAYQDAP
jgi:shikimate dehydrogenase